MMDIVGSPGTRAGLALRVSQFVFATGSAVAMMAPDPEYRYVAFRFIAYQMTMLSLWSFILGCIDIISLKKNWDLHSTGNAWMYLIGDWDRVRMVESKALARAASDTVPKGLAIGSLAAVSSAGGVVILLEIDMKYCSPYSSLACSQFQISVILGSMAWTFISASALSSFWLLVSLYN